MKIAVPLSMVPDLVEELKVDETNAALDLKWARLILNEFDDHALEQAILLKERGGGEVTVLIPELEGSDDILFTAAAKGSDRLISIKGAAEGNLNSHALAKAFGEVIQEIQPDLVLTGVQAHSDMDGQVGPLLAEHLGYSYVGYVAGVQKEDGRVMVRKEYPGGLIGRIEVALPAVLGIQTADQPRRYVAFSKVRQAMQSASIEGRDSSAWNSPSGISVTRMYQPEVSERATMLKGTTDEIASKFIQILREQGVL